MLCFRKYQWIFICFLFFSGCSDRSNLFDGAETMDIDSNIMQTSVTSRKYLMMYDETMVIYNQFLNGDIVAKDGENDITIDSLTIPTGEPDRRFATFVAYQDMTMDGIPELHVNSSRYYNIFTIIDDELVLWFGTQPSPYYTSLTNGAMMRSHLHSEENYTYIINDRFGKEIWSIDFYRYENVSDAKDIYKVNDVLVTKEQWYEFIEPYLYIDENGIERIRNEIEWSELFEEKN